VATQSYAARFEGLSNAYPDKEVHNIQDLQALGTGNMFGESTGVTLYL